MRPLSTAQRGIWVAQRLAPQSPVYNLAEYLEILGPVDPELFEKALRRVVATTDALHLRFVDTDDGPRQLSRPDADWTMPFVDVSAVPDPRAAAEAWMRADASRVADLARGPLFGYALFRAAADRYFWYQRNHHLTNDGFGGALVARRVAERYSALAEGRPAGTGEPGSWWNLLAEEERYRSSGHFVRDREYWRRELADLPEAVTLSGKPPVRGRGSVTSTAWIPSSQRDALDALGKEHGADLPAVLTTALGLYLHRFTGARDLTLGMTVSARVGAGMRATAGMVSNVLPLRLAVEPQAGFRDLLQQVRGRLRALLRRQRYRGEDLRQDLGLTPDAPEIFGTVVNVMPFDYALSFAGRPVRARNVGRWPVNDLMVVIYDRGDDSRVCTEFHGNAAHYTAEALAGHLRRFLSVLAQVVETPDLPSYRLALLDAEERQTLLTTFNATGEAPSPRGERGGETPPSPRGASLPELFEARVAHAPRAVAVVSDDGELTYLELNRRANRLAHRLIALGIGPEDVVGLALGRSSELVVALWAVLKTGAAYLPLDPAYPEARLSYMLADAAPSLVLTTAAVSGRLPAATTLVLDAPATRTALGRAAGHDPTDAERRRPLRPEHPAYVIYTSGSTGTPKGVVMPGGALQNLLAWHAGTLPGGEGTRVAQLTSISFDVSAQEILSALTQGKTLVTSDDELRHDPDRLLDHLERHGVHEVYGPTVVLEALCEAAGRREHAVPSLSHLVQAGEALRLGEAIRSFFRGKARNLYNHYGPTETHVATSYRLPDDVRDWPFAASIGAPIRNLRCYVLDAVLEPVPTGGTGELYLAGAGLARGYLHRPALTAERFVADPYAPGTATRTYRSGDLARWCPDGTLEFLGRADQQVKLRGFRIEPGEIEAVLRRQEGVTDALVTVHEQRLLAYVVGAPGDGARALQDELRRSLPPYMVPSAVVPLPAWPLTPSGKVDRRALPVPGREDPRGTYVAPRSETAEVLAGVWESVLDVEPVGEEDDFFALGGHSLNATRVMSRVQEVFGVDLTVGALFDAPRLGDLARTVEQARRTDGDAKPPLRPQERPPRIPTSYAQQRLWLLDQAAGTSAEYNLPEALRLRGELRVDALERAVRALVARHESLRTHFAEVDGEPHQVVLPEVHVPLPVEDLSALDETSRQAAVTAALRREWEEPFDLSRGPLLRVRLLKLGADASSRPEHVLLRTCHHVVSDGWSAEVFHRELAALYEAFCTGPEDPLPPLPLQYADFALWQRSWLDDEGGLDYWKEQLAGIPDRLDLPADRPRPAVRTSAAGYCQEVLPAEDVAALHRLSRQSQGGTTLYMTLLAAFAVLLSRYSGQDDVVVGSPSAGRRESGLEGLIGFFVNPLAMRVRVDPAASFRELLAAVRRTTLDAYVHEDVAFERLVDALQVERSRSHTPLFQVVLALQNAPACPRWAGLEVEPLWSDEVRVRFDLEAHVFENDGGHGGARLRRDGSLELGWLYNRDLFDRWRMEQMARHYVTLLRAAAASPDQPLYRLDVLSSGERRRLLEGFNPAPRELPAATLPELFEAQVARDPAAVALLDVTGGSLSYGELNARANRLAHRLTDLGVRPDTLVGVDVERSFEMVVAVLGILKAGGAYVPLAADLPALRREHLVADAGLRHVVTTDVRRSTYGETVEHVVTSDVPMLQDERNPRRRPFPEGLVYVNFTSGSTGRPKGVLVSHAGVVRLVHGAGYVRLESSSRLLQLAPLSFDAATFEIWGALLHGASLVIMPPGPISCEEIGEVLLRHRVDTLWLTAGLFHQLVEEALPALSGVRQLLAGGDVLSVDHVRRVVESFPECQVINGYGPTENTTFTTCHRVSASDPAVWGIPIGSPIAHTQVYVLDAFLEPVPTGVAGELYAGGAGLARGYLGNRSWTATRFVANPYASSGARMYRTGDRVRWRPTGELEFLGRLDDQVKLRGFRVEPGEVEAALRAQEGVESALVTVHGEGDRKRLVAYVVPDGWQGPGLTNVSTQQNLSHGSHSGWNRSTPRPWDGRNGAAWGHALQDALRRSLPGYMVPSAVVPLPSWPLNPHGKVDRRALPVPGRDGRGTYVPPGSETAKLLAGVWESVLDVEKVGEEDDFFALGGHSLNATQVMSRVRNVFGVDLPVRALFDGPRLGELARAVEQARRAGGDVRPTLRAWERPERIPLSYAQRRLWFLDQLEGASTEYNVPEALHLRGELQVGALERTIRALVDRHESLRTRFAEVDGEPYQVVVPEVHVPLPVEDLSALDETSRQRAVTAALRREWEEPFDLSRGPLLRVRLLKLGIDASNRPEHVLLRTCHHIVSDGWSAGVFRREFAALYEAFCTGAEDPLPPLPIQYADFALWQRSWLDGEAIRRGLEYWKEQLAGIPERPDLPADRPRPAVQTFAADGCHKILPAEDVAALHRLGREGQTTPYMTLLAAFAVLLSRYSGQDDVVVGSPVANRQESGLEGLIGFFVSSLVMRVRVDPAASFRELLTAVRRTTLDAFAHQDVPFERLVDALSVGRSLSHAPVFQVVLALQNAPTGRQKLSGLEVEPLPSDGMRVRMDLEAHAFENDGGHGGARLRRDGSLELGWIYNRDLFDRCRVEQMLRHYVALLRAAAASPDLPLHRLDVLDPAERHRLLTGFQGDVREVEPASVPELFEAQVRRDRDATALVSPDGTLSPRGDQGGVTTLSYGELDERANRLAHHLIGLGVGPEVLVGIALERSVERIVAVLATWKAGGAYLPLDPGYPEARLAYMLSDAAPAVVLTSTALHGRLPAVQKMVSLDAPETVAALAGLPAQAPAGGPELPPDPPRGGPELPPDPPRGGPELPPDPPQGGRADPRHAAYVIYTSGSTGRAKGVVVCHGEVTNLAEFLSDRLGMTSSSRMLQFASLNFDASVGEMVSTLRAGGALILLRPEETNGGVALRQALIDRQVTHALMTPGVLATLDEGDDLFLECLVVGGEACPGDLVGRWSAGRRMVNAYGPTETTVLTTMSSRLSGAGTPYVAPEARIPPLGRPIRNTRAYVLDAHLEPVPFGVNGELYVAGRSLVRGYLSNPALTAARFVPDPYAPAAGGERMYRTGDLVRRRFDGDLEFVGRTDDQVKLRGFRIEPGEVEWALRRQEGVEDALVTVQERAGQKRLVAYVVGVPEGGPDWGRALQDELRRSLPGYMVPSAVVPLAAWPLNPNGKLDRGALPAPEHLRTDGGRTAPSTDTEESLAAIWSEALGVEGLGVEDDFFELGGHSLLATQVISRLRERLGVEVALRQLFETPVLGVFARHVDALRRDRVAAVPPIRPTPRDGRPLPLSFAQQRLWFLDRMQPGNPFYSMPGAWRLDGRLDAAALGAVLAEIERRHEVLRSTVEVGDGEPHLRVLPAAPPPFPGDKSPGYTLKGALRAYRLKPGNPAASAAKPARRTAAGRPLKCSPGLQPRETAALPEVDLSGLPSGARRAELRRRLNREALRPFDLGRDRGMRCVLLRLGAAEHVLLVTFHHIVSDGWSIGVFVRELQALYAAAVTARRAGEPVCTSPLPEPAFQYADFALWQRGELFGKVLAEQLAYWRQELAGTQVLELPTDRPRPAFQRFLGGTATLELDAGRLEELGRRHGATLFMALLAAFDVLLFRMSGQRDVVAGTPIANRHYPGSEELIGLFVNTLALRARVAATFEELLAQVRETALGAYAHQDLPFEKLVEELRPERDLSRNPVFQVLFALQEAAVPVPELPGLTLTVPDQEYSSTRFDLELHVRPFGAGLSCIATYDRDLFDATTVRRLLRSFSVLLSSVAASPAAPLGTLPLLMPAERQALLVEHNDRAVAPPGEPDLAGSVAAWAAEQGDAVAFRQDGELLTYAGLEAEAGRLARHLRRLGVGPDVVVGLCVERTLRLPVALLAVLKAGGAYLPLDPTHPRQRLRDMLDDAGAPLVLTERHLAGLFDDASGTRSVFLEDLTGDPDGALPTSHPADTLAYVLYTSGSTGRPKGVEVTRRSVLSLFAAIRRELGLRRDDTVAAVTTVSFDISVAELLLPLTAGARVELVERETAVDGRRLATRLTSSGVTLLSVTPATWRLLLEAGWTNPTGLRGVSTGEALPRDLADKLPEGGKTLWNLYGPTEATVWSSAWRVRRKATPVLIGRPIAGTRFYLVDRDAVPVPAGAVGELWIGGAGLARGYRRRPALTAAVFVPDPFSGRPGVRLYRTGDLARYRADGTVECLGRIDHQVKVRGFRIEPAEIEARLAEHPAVAQAAVYAGGGRLVAHVTGPAGPPTAAELRTLAGYLAERLPSYMVPSLFVPLDELPRTASGKVDRTALGRRPLPVPEGTPAAPRSALQKALAAVWQELLERDDVGLDESFFEAGGHSLLLARLQTRLLEVLGRDVPMVDLFRHPTLRQLARYLGDEAEATEGGVPVPGAGRPPHSSTVAIVGMAGRFPGAPGVDELWDLVASGREGLRRFSPEELAGAGVPQEWIDDPGYVPVRGVVDGIDLFDADLFGFPPREAALVDPQQRLFLECAWEALENAGYPPRGNGEPVGVFAGTGSPEYPARLRSDPEVARWADGHPHLLSLRDFLATLVSYKLSLRGPSVNVQTACSTSLVAVHLACQSLLAGECRLALAGGVTLGLPQMRGHFYKSGGIVSPDGRCRAFDAAAAGTAGGDGVGVVVLKRLDDALEDGDVVRAVVCGTAVNNDGGLKMSFAAPSPGGQEAVIRAAHAAAGTEPQSVGYVETHGTATALGDQVEVTALKRAFGPGRPGSCALGAVKGNVGHTDTASGVTGLIKTVLVLEHRRIPPNVGFERPHPALGLEEGPFYVPRRLAEWPAGETPRRAGVSSFGVGGTNAHAVLEEAPPVVPSGPSRRFQLLLLSAHTPTSLAAAAARLADHLERGPQDGEDAARHLADVAYTLHVGRARLAYRRAVVAGTAAEAVEALRRPAAPSSAVPGRGVAFLLPGIGEHYPGMGAGLYEREAVFREAIDRCAEIAAPHLGRDLRRLLHPEPASEAPAATGLDLRALLGRAPADEAGMGKLSRTRHVHPAVFAVEYALAKLWMSWGVRPQAMIGHSLGEYVAATLAGVVSLEDVLELVLARARCIDELPEGAMLAVTLPEEEVEPYLGDGVWLAGVNAPRVTVVAGEVEAVEALGGRLAAGGVTTRRLPARHAFHSPLMEPAAEAVAAGFGRCDLRPPEIPLVSNVTGRFLTDAEATDPGYWARHLCRPVRFADGLAALLRESEPVLLEVGPGQGLGALALQHPAAGGGAVVASLRGRHDRQDDQAFLLTAVARLWIAGCEIDRTGFYAGETRRRTVLPTYGFERRRFWIEPRTAATPAGAGAAPVLEPHERPALPEAYAEPLTGLERQVAEVWEEVLGVAPVGLYDRYSDLGGHSLMAPQLLLHLERAVGVALPVAALLRHPTVAELAALVERVREEGFDAAADEAVDLAAEVTLDDGVRPATDAAEPRWQDPRAVFVTGGTGFLGAYLVEELLAQTGARLFCLVRAADEAAARTRLRSNLERHRVWSEAADERIEVVPGDLDQPRFGLSDDAFAALAERIDAVYHAGAWVNFTYPYSSLKPANVDGTREALRLAVAGERVRPFHFVSSVAVFGTGDGRGDVVYEDAPLDRSDGLFGGYAESKWVGEKIVGLARRRGIPAVIYRPGVIAGHSTTGAGNTSDLVWSFLRGCVELGATIRELRLLDVASVDYVARAIVALSLDAGSDGGTFHFSSPRPMPWAEVFDVVEAMGYPIRRLSYREWRAELDEAARAGRANALVPFLPLFHGQSEAGEIRHVRYDDRRTLEALTGSGVVCPPLDAGLVRTYLRYFVECGFLQPRARPPD